MDESKIYLGYDERTNAHLEYMGQWYVSDAMYRIYDTGILLKTYMCYNARALTGVLLGCMDELSI
jgi:hypothetical protein